MGEMIPGVIYIPKAGRPSRPSHAEIERVLRRADEALARCAPQLQPSSQQVQLTATERRQAVERALDDMAHSLMARRPELTFEAAYELAMKDAPNIYSAYELARDAEAVATVATVFPGGDATSAADKPRTLGLNLTAGMTPAEKRLAITAALDRAATELQAGRATLTHEAALDQVLREHPELYDEYVAAD